MSENLILAVKHYILLNFNLVYRYANFTALSFQGTLLEYIQYGSLKHPLV